MSGLVYRGERVWVDAASERNRSALCTQLGLRSSASDLRSQISDPGRRSTVLNERCPQAQANMSAAAVVGDDPRDPSAEVKLSLPETWQVESMGECSIDRPAPFWTPAG